MMVGRQWWCQPGAGYWSWPGLGEKRRKARPGAGLLRWSGPASIRGPLAFQASALPTELPDRVPPVPKSRRDWRS